MNQIDCYQNIGTKFIMTSKCRDQNGVFTKNKNKASVFSSILRENILVRQFHANIETYQNH